MGKTENKSYRMKMFRNGKTQCLRRMICGNISRNKIIL